MARRLHIASGTGLTLAMAGAFLVVAGRLWDVATGPSAPPPGSPAPSFTATTLEGESFELEAHRGQVLLLDFWASWCGPCVRSMPGLDSMHRQLSDRGFRVVGINQEPDSRDAIRRWVRERGLAFEHVVDEGQAIARAYAVYTYPTSVLIDRRGRIVQRYRGAVSPERIREDVLSVLDSP